MVKLSDALARRDFIYGVVILALLIGPIRKKNWFALSWRNKLQTLTAILLKSLKRWFTQVLLNKFIKYSGYNLSLPYS